MNQNVSLVTAQANCEEAVTQAVRLLSSADLQVVRSFDLRSARASHAECACPHHGTAQCTCQFVVLLVYGHGSAPVAVAAHGYDGQTWFSLVDTPQQPADLQLAAKIARVLAPQCFVPLSSWGALA
jgi:enterochelin esterase-like enzyme